MPSQVWQEQREVKVEPTKHWQSQEIAGDAFSPAPKQHPQTSGFFFRAIVQKPESTSNIKKMHMKSASLIKNTHIPFHTKSLHH
jgi:hypothetical protein